MNFETADHTTIAQLGRLPVWNKKCPHVAVELRDPAEGSVTAGHSCPEVNAPLSYATGANPQTRILQKARDWGEEAQGTTRKGGPGKTNKRVRNSSASTLPDTLSPRRPL